MLRALVKLLGGLERFIPGRIGANHGRLRHMMAVRSGVTGSLVGLGSASGEGFLCDLLGLLGYPSGSGVALLDGTLKLRYHTIACARRKPTWRLPISGQVPQLVVDFGGGEVFGGCPS